MKVLNAKEQTAEKGEEKTRYESRNIQKGIDEELTEETQKW